MIAAAGRESIRTKCVHMTRAPCPCSSIPKCAYRHPPIEREIGGNLQYIFEPLCHMWWFPHTFSTMKIKSWNLLFPMTALILFEPIK